MTTRQTISLTTPNNSWLKAQVESEEYASKSELVNDLIRKARERERNYIRAKLAAAEDGGFVTQSADEILEEIKQEAREDGLL